MKETKDIKLMIIENFIDHYTTNDAERVAMKEEARTYVEEDHVDEIAQAGFILPPKTHQATPFLKEGEVRLKCIGGDFLNADVLTNFIDVSEPLKNYLVDHELINYDGKQWTFVEENSNEILKIKNACK